MLKRLCELWRCWRRQESLRLHLCASDQRRLSYWVCCPAGEHNDLQNQVVTGLSCPLMKTRDMDLYLTEWKHLTQLFLILLGTIGKSKKKNDLKNLLNLLSSTCCSSVGAQIMEWASTLTPLPVWRLLRWWRPGWRLTTRCSSWLSTLLTASVRIHRSAKVPLYSAKFQSTRPPSDGALNNTATVTQLSVFSCFVRSGAWPAGACTSMPQVYTAGIRFKAPVHISAVAEELAIERGSVTPGSENHGMWVLGLKIQTKQLITCHQTTWIYKEGCSEWLYRGSQ